MPELRASLGEATLPQPRRSRPTPQAHTEVTFIYVSDIGRRLASVEEGIDISDRPSFAVGNDEETRRQRLPVRKIALSRLRQTSGVHYSRKSSISSLTGERISIDR